MLCSFKSKTDSAHPPTSGPQTQSGPGPWSTFGPGHYLDHGVNFDGVRAKSGAKLALVWPRVWPTLQLFEENCIRSIYTNRSGCLTLIVGPKSYIVQQ